MITNEDIKKAIDNMQYDWEEKKDITFIRIYCEQLAREIRKREEADN